MKKKYRYIKNKMHRSQQNKKMRVYSIKSKTNQARHLDYNALPSLIKKVE